MWIPRVLRGLWIENSWNSRELREFRLVGLLFRKKIFFHNMMTWYKGPWEKETLAISPISKSEMHSIAGNSPWLFHLPYLYISFILALVPGTLYPLQGRGLQRFPNPPVQFRLRLPADLFSPCIFICGQITTCCFSSHIYISWIVIANRHSMWKFIYEAPGNYATLAVIAFYDWDVYCDVPGSHCLSKTGPYNIKFCSLNLYSMYVTSGVQIHHLRKSKSNPNPVRLLKSKSKSNPETSFFLKSKSGFKSTPPNPNPQIHFKSN